MSDKKGLGGLVITFLMIVIGLALTSTIQSSMQTTITGASPTAANLTGVSATLVALVPLFWIIIVLSIGIAAVYLQIKGTM